MAERYERALALDGMRPRHAGLLFALDALEHPTQSDVGAWLGIGPSAVVALLDDAELRGLVERQVDEANRRRTLVRTTRTGREQYQRAAEAAHELDRELLAELSEAEVSAFSQALRKIAVQLQIAGQENA